jgi:hypothetical protein
VAGARDPGGVQHLLHPRLVAHVARGGDVEPGDAERLPDLRERHLQLLQGPDQPLHRPELPGQALHGIRDLPRVQRVVHPPVPGEVPGEVGRHLLRGGGGDDGQPHAGQLRRGRDEPDGGRHQERRDEHGDDHQRKLPCWP